MCVCWFPQVNELRSSSDEVARIQLAHQQEGLEPPADLHFDFADLMKLVRPSSAAATL